MRLYLALLFFAISLSSLSAQEWKKGDTLPPLQWKDQTGTTRNLSPDTVKLFFTADMPASKIVNGVLEARDADVLPIYKAILVSDIHKMPSLISRFVAIPKMKGYKYKIHLIEDSESGKPFPKLAEKITYLRLNQGKIEDVQFLSTAAEFQTALEKP